MPSGLEFLEALGGGNKKALYGTKPVVPSLKDATKQAIEANKELLPSLKSISSDVNLFTAEQINKMAELLQPGYSSLRDRVTQTYAGDWASLPKDVEDYISRKVAERGVGRGTLGTQFDRFDAARQIGMTSHEVFQRNLDSASRWVAAARTGPIFDFTKMFISPEDQFNRNWMQATVTAAPNPGARGVLDLQMSTLGMILSIYGGGAGYQNSYRPSYGSPGGGSLYGTQYDNRGNSYYYSPQPVNYNEAAYGGGGGGSAPGDFGEGFGEQFSGYA